MNPIKINVKNVDDLECIINVTKKKKINLLSHNMIRKVNKT